jgi:hypothetical protein
MQISTAPGMLSGIIPLRYKTYATTAPLPRPCVKPVSSSLLPQNQKRLRGG